MARESLYEESAQVVDKRREGRRYSIFSALGWIFACVAFIMTAIVVTFILPQIVSDAKAGTMGTGAVVLNIVIWFGACAVSGLGAFFAFRFRRRFNVSYDYTFVEDEIRITRVYNGKRRKHIVTVKADEIVQLGYFGTESYERILNANDGTRSKIFTPNDTPDKEKIFIYLLVSDSAGKIVYVLECRQKLLECLVFAAGRNKFTKE